MSRKVQWLDRSMIASPYFCLCLSEASFRDALKHLKVPESKWPEWITLGKDATTHHLETNDEEAHIVCMRPSTKHERVQIHALLVHEAVHIWQAHRDNIGEDKPGIEHEAYSIQHLSQELMFSYEKQMKRRR